MAKISVIGICGYSLFMALDHFHATGETLSADTIYEEMGGKGINQAIAASRMKAEVSFLAAVGNDSSAHLCEKLLEECNIKHTLLVKEGKRTPMAVILTDKKGENKVTVYKSAELEADDVELFRKEIKSSDFLLLQNEVPEEVNRRAVEIAKEYGVKVILNPAPPRKLDNDFKGLYLATPNEQESEYIDKEQFENTVVTLGSKGCLINSKTHLSSLGKTPIDTTGAGDTFNGVLAVLLAEGKDLVTASEYAIVASGISVTKKYVIDSIPSRDEIEEELKNYKKERE